MPQTIWLARHANREDFVDPDWAATADRPHDPGLSDDGIEQARKLGQRLADAAIAHVYASPFLRTVHTAHCVARAVNRPLVLEPGLAEWMNPAWFDARPEPLSTETLAARFPHRSLPGRPVRTAQFPRNESRGLRPRRGRRPVPRRATRPRQSRAARRSRRLRLRRAPRAGKRRRGHRLPAGERHQTRPHERHLAHYRPQRHLPPRPIRSRRPLPLSGCRLQLGQRSCPLE